MMFSLKWYAGLGGAVVTLSGATVAAADLAGGTATATLRIDADGNVYSVVNGGSATQLSSSTDWVRPTTAAPGSYKVKYTNLVGDTITAPVAENAEHSLSGGDADYTLSQSGAGSKSATFDLQILLGSSVVGSNSYTLTVDVT